MRGVVFAACVLFYYYPKDQVAGWKDYTDKPLADINLDYHKIKKLTHKLNEHSIRHASALIKTRYTLQFDTSNNSQGLGPGATAHNPPDPH